MAKKIVDFYHGEEVSSFDALVDATYFVILKASQGTTLDPKCKARIKEFEKRKHPYWLYVFLNKGNELAQTKFMVNNYKDVVGKYFVGYVIDIERNNSVANCVEAMTWLKKQGTKTMAYISWSGYDTYYKLVKMVDSNMGIWECRYGKNDGTDTSAKYPFHKLTDLGQYTEKGKCAGLSGTIDLNKVTGYGHKLEWFTTPLTTSTPSTTTTQKSVTTTVKSSKKQIKVTNKDGANVRMNANVSAKLCTKTSKLKYGEVVTYVSTEKDSRGVTWYLIEKNGNRGYVSGKVAETV